MQSRRRIEITTGRADALLIFVITKKELPTADSMIFGSPFKSGTAGTQTKARQFNPDLIQIIVRQMLSEQQQQVL